MFTSDVCAVSHVDGVTSGPNQWYLVTQLGDDFIANKCYIVNRLMAISHEMLAAWTPNSEVMTWRPHDLSWPWSANWAQEIKFWWVEINNNTDQSKNRHLLANQCSLNANTCTYSLGIFKKQKGCPHGHGKNKIHLVIVPWCEWDYISYWFFLKATRVVDDRILVCLLYILYHVTNELALDHCCLQYFYHYCLFIPCVFFD